MCLNVVAQRPCHWACSATTVGREVCADEKPGLTCDGVDGTLGYTAAKGARPWLGAWASRLIPELGGVSRRRAWAACSIVPGFQVSRGTRSAKTEGGSQSFFLMRLGGLCFLCFFQCLSAHWFYFLSKLLQGIIHKSDRTYTKYNILHIIVGKMKIKICVYLAESYSLVNKVCIQTVYVSIKL